jgi:glycosyltransferase involved in cell wall biosynthesis
MRSPWLTVVIPSHLGEAWIDQALKSLAAEPADGIEVLVIDSSPNSLTRDLARGYSDRLDVRVFERCDLATWQAKTNFGVETARSDHLCWLGVDDVWLPGRVAAVRSWIAADPHARLHLAPVAIIDKEGRNLGLWRCPLPADRALPVSLVLERLLVQNFVSAPSPVFRRDAWLGCGGLDTELWYTADWDIWLKLAACGPVYYHPEVAIGFRIHAGSLTASGSRDVDDFSRQMSIVLERHLPRAGAGSKGVERAARASIAVNCALAAAATGDLGRLPRAAMDVLRLGPVGIGRYLRDSRILDRLAPRVRAKLANTF